MADTDNAVLFGTSSKFGTLTGWNPEDPTINETSQVARTTNGTADITDAKAYDTTTETTQGFTAASTTAPTVPATLGTLMGGKLVTKISIKTSATDYAKMDITGHNHASNPHESDGTKNTLTHGITLSSGFGAQNFLASTLGDACDVESSDVDITIQHRDIVTGANGNHYKGQNFQGLITCKQVFRGVPTTIADSSWKIVSAKQTGEKKDDYVTFTVTAEKWVAMTVPTP